MSDGCASDYMRRWGLSCRRPAKCARKQDAARVQRWKEEEYPAIAQRAQEENATIYWGDETGISNSENYERDFSPKGQPPILSVETKKERLNMISALASQGEVRYMLYEGSMDQQCMIAFLRNIIRTSKQKIFLILDNLKVHHGNMVSEWVSRPRPTKRLCNRREMKI